MIDTQPYHTVSSIQLLSDPDVFAERIDEATRILFGSEELGLAVRALTRQMREDCRRLQERGLTDTPAIAIVGIGAWGKSWLTRCFLEKHSDNEQVRADIRTGQNSEDRTDRLTWLVPRGVHISEESAKDEIVLRVPTNLMLDLGSPYRVIDTPAISSGKASAQLVHRAATSAPIKLVVASVGQLRDGDYENLVRAIDGSVIVPVVLFTPEQRDQDEPIEDERETAQTEIRRWHEFAPAADIRSDELIFMPRADIFGPDRAIDLVRQRLQNALKPLLASPVQLEIAIDRQIRERIVQTRSEIRKRIELFRERVSPSLEAVEQKQRIFPQRILEELCGDDVLFRAGLRQRFRIDWIERTPLGCFPYRSLLGVLALTHGAWDRLVFATFGSIPSLAFILFRAFKNTRDAQQVRRIWEGRLQARIEELLREQFYTVVRNFRTALSACLHSDEDARIIAPRAIAIHLRGLSALETTSRQILSETVQRDRARDCSVLLYAGLGLGSFVYLIVGPLVFLYGSYLEAHTKTFRLMPRICADSWIPAYAGMTSCPWKRASREKEGASRNHCTDFIHEPTFHGLFAGQDLQNLFPELSLSMLLTSLLLSLAPAFLIALLAMSWSCYRGRVSKALESIQASYEQEVADRFADETLAIEIDDPEVEAARFLLNL